MDDISKTILSLFDSLSETKIKLKILRDKNAESPYDFSYYDGQLNGFIHATQIITEWWSKIIMKKGGENND